MQAQLFMTDLPATQQFWSNQCVTCFVKGETFNHIRGNCSSSNNSRPVYVGSLLLSYKDAVQARWGKAQCWACMMPFNCCPKWNIEGTGRVRTKRIEVPCVNKYAIRDTWAYLWDKCTGARTEWIQWVQTHPEPRDGSGEDWANWSPGTVYPDLTPEFAKYWTSVVDFGDDFKAGRIVLALNWLTHEFFLPNSPRHYTELLASP